MRSCSKNIEKRPEAKHVKTCRKHVKAYRAALKKKYRALNYDCAQKQVCSFTIVLKSAQKPFKFLGLSMTMLKNYMFLYGF